MANLVFSLTVLNDQFAISRLDSLDDVPEWCHNSKFSSITRTPEELSIVSIASDVPRDIKSDGPWRALKVRGPLPVETIGIFSILAPLLENALIPVCAVSTFDTDYILVTEDKLDVAVRILQSDGHFVD